jgi:hypothetical protein
VQLTTAAAPMGCAPAAQTSAERRTGHLGPPICVGGGSGVAVLAHTETLHAEHDSDGGRVSLCPGRLTLTGGQLNRSTT